MAWAGMARRVAAAARLMAGMIGRAVDGLEGGDAAGHLKLRGGNGVGKVAESSEVAPSAQAVYQYSNAADFTIARTAAQPHSSRAACGVRRARSVSVRGQFPTSQLPVCCRSPPTAAGRPASSAPVTKLIDLAIQSRPAAMRSIPARPRRRPGSGARPIADVAAPRLRASKRTLNDRSSHPWTRHASRKTRRGLGRPGFSRPAGHRHRVDERAAVPGHGFAQSRSQRP